MAWVADGIAQQEADAVAVESPLTLVLDGEVPDDHAHAGHDLDQAAGWLVRARSGEHDIVRLPRGDPWSRHRHCRVSLAPEYAHPDLGRSHDERLRRVQRRPVGQLPGPDAALHSTGWHLPAERVPALIAAMRERQRMFDQTGALHAAALIGPDFALRWVREDVGRHNAVDKAVGRALFDDLLPLTDHLLLVSGRTSYEIVHKALTAGVAAVVGLLRADDACRRPRPGARSRSHRVRS
jgi:FdhD protein